MPMLWMGEKVMLNQYNAQRFRYKPLPSGRTVRVGTVPVGTVVYLQDGINPLSSFPHWPVCRNPWIVEAWTNREYFPCVAGRPSTLFMLGGHLAIVRSLRDSRTVKVADWLLLRCVEAGLERN